MASNVGILAEFVTRSDQWEHRGGTHEQLLRFTLPIIQSVLPQADVLRLYYTVDEQLSLLAMSSHTEAPLLSVGQLSDTIAETPEMPDLITTLAQPVLLFGSASRADYALEIIGAGSSVDEIDTDDRQVLQIVATRLNALLGRQLETADAAAVSEMRQLYNLSSDLLSAQNGMDVLRALRTHLVPDAHSLILVSLDWDRASRNLTSLFIECRLHGDEGIQENKERIYQLDEKDIENLKAEWELQGQQVDVIEDLAALLPERPALQFSYDTGVRASIVIPIFREGLLRQQITITFHTPRHIDAGLRRLLNAAREQIGVVLHNVRLLESTRHQSIQLERIARFSEAVQSTLEIDKLLDIALFSVPQILVLDHIDIAFYDPMRGALCMVAWQQEDNNTIQVDLNSDWIIADTHTSLWHVWETRLPLQISDVRRETRLKHHSRSDLRALMTQPIFSHGSAHGVVEIGSTRPGAYTSIDSAVFQQLVGQLSIAIENAEAYTQSRRLAMTKVTVNDISASLSQHRDIEQLLNVTITELGRALGARKGRIRLEDIETSGVVRDDAD